MHTIDENGNHVTLYRVDIIEFERGYGQRLERTAYYHSEEQARNFVSMFNEQNDSDVVPDWYMIAVYIGAQ